MDYFYTDDQKMLRDSVRKYAEGSILPAAAAIDRDDAFPREIYRGMADLGLFGVSLAEAAGGSGLDTTAACIAMEEIARCSGSVGNMFAIPVEAAQLLHEHGNDFHKSWIPKILDGSAISATAVTEPDAGSDVAGMRTIATLEGDEYVISGTKAWVTFGSIFDFIMVFAKTSRDPGQHNISCFLVEGDRKGIVRGRNEALMGMHGLEDCQVTFDGVRIPARNRLGPENRAFKMAMSNFNFSRLMMSSMALGMARAAYEDGYAYAKDRRQFGGPIFNFPRVHNKLAMMAAEIMAVRQLTYFAARQKDEGKRCDLEAGMAKLLGARVAWAAADNALQIHGGNGFAMEYKISRVLADARILNIFEGAGEIQAQVIARRLLEGAN